MKKFIYKIKPLLFKVSEVLENTPLFPLYDNVEEELDTKIYNLPDEEKEFYIERVDAHTWRILGEKIIKFYRMTNITTDDGMMVLITRLRKLKIDDALESLGAKDGDEVILDDFTFEYVS